MKKEFDKMKLEVEKMKNSSDFVNSVIYNDLLKTARKVFKENKEKFEDQIEEA